jgi:hypothetical protein
MTEGRQVRGDVPQKKNGLLHPLQAGGRRVTQAVVGMHAPQQAARVRWHAHQVGERTRHACSVKAAHRL